MKIFFITIYFPKGNSVGGAEIQCVLLAKYLGKRGHETVYFALKENQGVDEEWGIRSKGLMERGGGTWQVLLRFYVILKKEKPDICYIRSFSHLFILNLICKLAKVKVVYNTTHINNCTPYQKIEFSFNLRRLGRSIRAAIQHYFSFKTLRKINLLTISELHAKILKKKYRIIGAHSIYNSMEDNYKGGIRKKKKNVVWVNNIKPRKNPEIFIKLANEFRNSDWKFLMIGEIQGRGYLEQLKTAEFKNPQLKYLGPRTIKEVDEILAKAQIFVNTCEPEGFGNNFIQAWFAECPTITLKFDPDDIIKNNRIGFHSQTFEQMVKNLSYLMNHEDERIKMGRRARKYALENHNIDKNILKYESYFNKIKDIKSN